MIFRAPFFYFRDAPGRLKGKGKSPLKLHVIRTPPCSCRSVSGERFPP